MQITDTDAGRTVVLSCFICIFPYFFSKALVISVQMQLLALVVKRYIEVMSRVVSCSNPEPQTKVGVTTGRVGSTCAGVGGSVGRWERKTRLIADN